MHLVATLVGLLPLFVGLTQGILLQTPASQRKAFIQAGLVPDVLPSFNPQFVLDVTYILPNALGEVKAVDPPGRNFTMPQTLNRPIWSIPFIPFKDPELIHDTFVVAMVDPDALTPQDPALSQIRHFLGGGFKLQSTLGLEAVLVNNTPALSDYLQPQPPNFSDPHRYTWLIFRQPMDFPTSVTPNIENFNISAFAEQFNLGPPLAGNYMTLSTNPADLAAAGES